MSPRVPRQQLSVRLGNPPLGVKILTPGCYRDAVDLYRAAESHARSVDSSARVENCAGSTSSILHELGVPIRFIRAQPRPFGSDLVRINRPLRHFKCPSQRGAQPPVGVSFGCGAHRRAESTGPRRRAGRRIAHPPKASTADGVGHALNLPDLGGPSSFEWFACFVGRRIGVASACGNGRHIRAAAPRAVARQPRAVLCEVCAGYEASHRSGGANTVAQRPRSFGSDGFSKAQSTDKLRCSMLCGPRWRNSRAMRHGC